MPTPSFSIKTCGNCILIKKSEEWDLKTDIAYLSALCNEMNKRKGKAFYVVADMRNWSVPDAVKQSKTKVAITMDRRNQKGEIWLLSDMAAADHLLSFFDGEPFPLERVTTSDELLAWISPRVAESVSQEIAQWLPKPVC
ncbi:hypothetical protein [Alteromonas antoniana]|uniref:hypothetical protein n=1 Tax=Alteromonas antoniana TaxID=2803813 RepID=UPI001C4567AA|nr:hypothetical protein [Alteromonas antoniana]